MELYDQAIQINPHYAGTYFNKGLSLAKLGIHEEALELYNQAIQVNPHYAGTYNNKGFSLAAYMKRHWKFITKLYKSILIMQKHTIIKDQV
ncbi:tetratricopeptide repeat protein [Rickettsia sp. MEAM1 (Bemisia tabaci)]|uniref:tetratricopeptide repeat protein n=1 Tax=Rickettsia sp. MEAM1 (Bemisia tabaci) TaxID=1182263 RepID=UPI000A03E653|nr:tetratricopeptide repeat protein [Rickettsia sp. MEAM1 (Bemisia tabaci)]